MPSTSPLLTRSSCPRPFVIFLHFAWVYSDFFKQTFRFNPRRVAPPNDSNLHDPQSPRRLKAATAPPRAANHRQTAFPDKRITKSVIINNPRSEGVSLCSWARSGCRRRRCRGWNPTEPFEIRLGSHGASAFFSRASRQKTTRHGTTRHDTTRTHASGYIERHTRNLKVATGNYSELKGLSSCAGSYRG